MDERAAYPDAGVEFLGFVGSPSPGHAGDATATRMAAHETTLNRGRDTHTPMFDNALAPGDSPDASLALHRELLLPDQVGAQPVAHRRAGAINGWAERARSLAPDLSGTTPTLLPDLLRSVSKQAGRLAGDPFNALDNNPFIMREWLIVSQVLHAAAMTMERRFEALFLGL